MAKRIRINDVKERLERRRVILPDGCWQWTGTTNNMGYGMTSVQGRPTLVHRVAFELFKAPIDAGFVLDHTCGNRACFNPDHLEQVTQKENTLRSTATLGWKNKQKTHCPQGHPYDEANTYVYVRKSPRQCTTRRCKACAAEQARARNARKKDVA